MYTYNTNMINNILNNLQLYKGKRFSDLIDENMITNALQMEPYKVNQLVSFIFGTKDNGYSSSLDFITGGLGNKLVVDRPEYEWELFIESEKAVTIHQATYDGATIGSGSTVLPGINLTPIQLYLEEKLFGPKHLGGIVVILY